ncbi:MAG: amino acid adenylation domain-containing protein [Lachnospiraceae bacterium]|nr:amino acid adenylation domain-containing protein [Lachnospiraceae bacterium]
MNNILEYLDSTVARFPEKIAAKDEKKQCTYLELQTRARQIGTCIARKIETRKPVAVFMEKSVDTLQIFMGIVSAGDFYVLIDPSFPLQRIQQILSVLNPEIVITKEEHKEKLNETGYEGIVWMDSDLGCDVDMDLLSKIRKQSLNTDPLYGIFTSGSTGVPKGVVICHRSVIDFIDNFTEIFNITENDVIGNQAPFDFDVSVKDIYSCLKTGATLVIIPKAYFMFPNNVVDMLEDNKVTTLIWAVSALCLLNRLHGLKYKVPSAINKIMFSGEMMPIKQLNQWRNHYPNAMFVNLYGPTEITCNCTYYILDREFSEDEKLPMGEAFPNERVFLLDDENKEVTEPKVSGEVCVAGTALALGYYNNPEMTAKAFTVNPLNPNYPELIYHTGDLAYYGEDGQMYFAGRKDFQIKHMGHRIELEEIDTALNSLCGVERACTFFDERKNKVVCFYVGTDDKKSIIDDMKTKVPEFMVPNVFMQVEEMPLTKNGKIDRGYLKELYQNGGKDGK